MHRGWVGEEVLFPNDHVYDRSWSVIPKEGRFLDALFQDGKRFFIWKDYIMFDTTTKRSRSSSKATAKPATSSKKNKRSKKNRV
jgi:hypothetical protein